MWCAAQEDICLQEISSLGRDNLRVSDTIPARVAWEYCSVLPLQSYLGEIDQHQFLQTCYDVCGEDFVEYFSSISWGKIGEIEYCSERPDDISPSEWEQLQSAVGRHLVDAHARIRRAEEELMQCLEVRGLDASLE